MRGLGKGWLVSLVAMVGALLLFGAACYTHGAGSDPSKETPAFGVTEVRLEDFGDAPANIVIDAGTTVIWTNYDGVGHTVTSDEGEELESEQFSKTETFRHTFDTPGEYYYHCKPHSNMHGLVTVRLLP
ncbi:MAG: cupredoxin domain-containing protein [Chloroflexi bacterium]|nr:cupredoxin domain-containing protein [Chloroflexota bacterium]